MNNNSPPDIKNSLLLPDHDLGYWYDRQVVAGLHGEIKLSPNVQQHCRCGGKPPFMILNAQSGEPTWCPCRLYRKKIAQIDHYIKRSGIPAPFRYKYLDDFKKHYEDGQPIPGAEQLEHFFYSLIDGIRNSERANMISQDPGNSHKITKGFYLWGSPGNGKTYFSYVILNELIFKFVKPGKFISLSKSFQELRHTFDEESITYGQAVPIMEMLSSVPFLVIDDFGVQRNTEWELEMLYNLIDGRYANQRLTFVTTNQNITDLKELAQGRIYSRLLEMCRIIHCAAPDYREKNNPKDKWTDFGEKMI